MYINIILHKSLNSHLTAYISQCNWQYWMHINLNKFQNGPRPRPPKNFCQFNPPITFDYTRATYAY